MCDGMAGAPQGEQDAFLAAHPALYRRAPNGRVRLAIRDGAIALGSLDMPGLAVGAMPDFDAMTRALSTTLSRKREREHSRA